MSHEADQICYQVVGKNRTHSLGFIEQLDDGELMTGTPTILEVTTTDLTITSKAVSTTALTIDGDDHLAGQALQCSVISSTAGTYEITWLCATNATPSQDMYGKTTIIIEAE